MSRIDINKLKASVENTQDPYDFYLYVVLSKGGSLEDCPYCKDKKFLERLLQHYETIEDYELCLDIRKRLKELS